ncbi:mucosal addressin cell adhesion molecule 1, partial [Carlito syrichta]|uniref:Mucosal addressin cell adhesion molecule 1 n=1 Tax=Carlito syrichta TaxID=1868482 RepID=A0A3Q0DRE4_CARSF
MDPGLALLLVLALGLLAAFPDKLTVAPTALVPGQDREVACTAHEVWPPHLSFALLLGHQELKGAQALDPEVEEAASREDEDPLLRVTQRWRLPPLGTRAPPALYCQVTMRLPGLQRSYQRAIPVLHSPTSLEPLETASPDWTSQEPPKTASPEPPTTASQAPPDTTSPQTSPYQGPTWTPCPEIPQARPTGGGVILES